jgi:hypothetical protein
LRAQLALALGLALALASPPAHAQVNSDVGLSAGVMKRFTTSTPDGVPQPGFGPVVDLRGHIAVLPMLRVGLYAAYDWSPASSATPVGGDAARSFVTGGLHVKLTPPLLPFPWKTYLFTGFGAGYVDGGDGVTGGLLEVPLGLGLARKLGSGSGWEPFAELGGRFGVATFGAAYEAGHAGFAGADSFALSLSVGVSLTN